MTSSNPRRAVLYGRVSSLNNDARARSGETTETRSVDDQLAELREWAEKQNVIIVAEHRDDGISASRYRRGKEREQWERVMELILAGNVDILAVWELSRASRDRTASAMLVTACQDRNVLISINGKIHDPNDPDDAFMLDLNAALAAKSSALQSAAIKRAGRARAARGEPHGRVVDGYMIEYDPRNGAPIRRVKDPKRAPIIREIADRLLAGDAAYAIAADLNRRGLTTVTGKQWRGGNVVKRMQSPTLAGLRVHLGSVLDGVVGEWEPILTVEEHHRLQALFRDPQRKHNKEGSRVKHLGTGIYRCGVCNSVVRIIVGKRPDGSKRVRYGCEEKHCVQRMSEPVDALVEGVIVDILSDPEVTAARLNVDDDGEARAAAEVARLRAELIEARELHRLRKLSLESLAHMESWMLPEIGDAERRANRRWVPAAIAETCGPDAPEKWAALDMPVKRSILKALAVVRIMRTTYSGAFDPSAVVVAPR